jgi:outer membrane protein
MKKIISIIFVLVLSMPFSYAQQRHELTVREAVELAYKNVIDIKNAEIDYKMQEAVNKEIVGRALPQITGNVGANHYLKLPDILFPDATDFRIYSVLKDEGVSGSSGPITTVPTPQLRQVSFQQPWNLTTGATLTQLLFQPDVFVGLQARKAALDLSAAMIEQTKERVKDSAYKRYYAILIAEKQLHFMNESVVRLEKLYRDNTIMFENGFAERLDIDRVQVQLNNLTTSRSVLQNSITLAYAGLKFALGLPQQDVVVLKEELTTEAIKEEILEDGFVYENRAEIRTLNYTKEFRELDIKRYKLSALPTVAFTGNYTINGMGQKFFTNSSTVWINSAFVGLNIGIPLFDGNQRRQKMQQAKYTVQKIENTIDNVKQAIDLEQVVTRESFRNALLNLDAQERNSELAERVYNTTKRKFEEGLGSSFEVLQAETDYQTAQANYFTALYNATIAKVSYQYSLGKLQ